MSIQKETDISNELTTYTVNGKVTLDEILSEVESFYDGDPTPNVLWDFRDAILWAINAKDVEIISSYRSRFTEGSIRKKTGLIISDEHSQNLAIWFQGYGKIDELPFGVEVFRTKSEAIEWLSVV